MRKKESSHLRRAIADEQNEERFFNWSLRENFVGVFQALVSCQRHVIAVGVLRVRVSTIVNDEKREVNEALRS